MATSTWKADMWEMYVHIYIPLLAVLDCFEREDLAHFSKELRVKENKQEVKKLIPLVIIAEKSIGWIGSPELIFLLHFNACFMFNQKLMNQKFSTMYKPFIFNFKSLQCFIIYTG